MKARSTLTVGACLQANSIGCRVAYLVPRLAASDLTEKSLVPTLFQVVMHKLKRSHQDHGNELLSIGCDNARSKLTVGACLQANSNRSPPTPDRIACKHAPTDGLVCVHERRLGAPASRRHSARFHAPAWECMTRKRSHARAWERDAFKRLQQGQIKAHCRSLLAGEQHRLPGGMKKSRASKLLQAHHNGLP